LLKDGAKLIAEAMGITAARKARAS
jgi:hypothetical protein